jgi:hypothetical protein
LRYTLDFYFSKVYRHLLRMTEDSIDFSSYKFCECGCGQEVSGYYYKNKQKIQRKFKHGHYLKGRWIGKNNPRWKGRAKFMTNGYLEIYRLEYHHKLTNSSVKLHRFVYEYFHKCCLLSWTHIHHINGIKTDNHKNNIIALSRSKHATIHMIGNKNGKRRS